MDECDVAVPDVAATEKATATKATADDKPAIKAESNHDCALNRRFSWFRMERPGRRSIVPVYSKSIVDTYPFLHPNNEKDLLLTQQLLEKKPWEVRHGQTVESWAKFSFQLAQVQDRLGDRPFQDLRLHTVKDRFFKYLHVANKWKMEIFRKPPTTIANVEKNGADIPSQIENNIKRLHEMYEDFKMKNKFNDNSSTSNNNNKNFTSKPSAGAFADENRSRRDHPADDAKARAEIVIDPSPDVAVVTATTTNEKRLDKQGNESDNDRIADHLSQQQQQLLENVSVVNGSNNSNDPTQQEQTSVRLESAGKNKRPVASIRSDDDDDEEEVDDEKLVGRAVVRQKRSDLKVELAEAKHKTNMMQQELEAKKMECQQQKLEWQQELAEWRKRQQMIGMITSNNCRAVEFVAKHQNAMVQEWLQRQNNINNNNHDNNNKTVEEAELLERQQEKKRVVSSLTANMVDFVSNQFGVMNKMVTPPFAPQQQQQQQNADDDNNTNNDKQSERHMEQLGYVSSLMSNTMDFVIKQKDIMDAFLGASTSGESV